MVVMVCYWRWWRRCTHVFLFFLFFPNTAAMEQIKNVFLKKRTPNRLLHILTQDKNRSSLRGSRGRGEWKKSDPPLEYQIKVSARRRSRRSPGYNHSLTEAASKHRMMEWAPPPHPPLPDRRSGFIITCVLSTNSQQTDYAELPLGKLNLFTHSPLPGCTCVRACVCTGACVCVFRL